MTVKELRSKRRATEIPAIVLAAKAHINRSRLSGIECGRFEPTQDELERLSIALEQLVQAKLLIQQAACSAGWPGAGPTV